MSITEGLAGRLARDGVKHVSEAVGVDAVQRGQHAPLRLGTDPMGISWDRRDGPVGSDCPNSQRWRPGSDIRTVSQRGCLGMSEPKGHQQV
jgi:hypothetical protein